MLDREGAKRKKETSDIFAVDLFQLPQVEIWYIRAQYYPNAP